MKDLVEMPERPCALTPAPTLSRTVAPLPFHQQPAIRNQLAIAVLTVFAMATGVLGGRWLVASPPFDPADLPPPIAAEPLAQPRPLPMPYELELIVLDVGALAAGEPSPEQVLEPEPCR